MTLDALRQPPAERPDVEFVDRGDGRMIPCVTDISYHMAKLRLLALGRPDLEMTVISPRCRQ